jgi:C1A family cysteine protease
MTAQDYEFMKYVTEYGKMYGTKAEFNLRSELFKKELAHIEEQNASGNNTHTLALNHMADWTADEYNKLLGYKAEYKTERNNVFLDTTEPAADELNWVTQGAVTPVKNQEQCGSCWAFSSTGSIEGAEFLHGTKQLVSLSEQNLVDCSKENDGCDGGLMDRAFEFVKTHPLMTEAEYPYTAHSSKFTKCKYVESKGVGHVKSYHDVPEDNVAQMKTALANGPVSVAIEADKSVFQSYRRGVITSRGCGKKLDHGVLAVGYGTEDGEAYWLVKNSWGATWGVEGYVKIGENDICGILQQASYPTE